MTRQGRRLHPSPGKDAHRSHSSRGLCSCAAGSSRGICLPTRRSASQSTASDAIGSTAGVITVEDVLEQLVGELEDAFDVASAQSAVTDANAPIVLDGAVNIRDLETQYDLKLSQDEGFETLAGFVLSRLQKLPAGGEAFDYENRRFVVEKMEGHRIATIRIEPKPVTPSQPHAFVKTVCLIRHLDRLPEELRDSYIDRVLERSAPAQRRRIPIPVFAG